MNLDRFRAAIAAAQVSELDIVIKALNGAFCSGEIGEGDYFQLEALARDRQACRSTMGSMRTNGADTTRSRVGSRPRTSESMNRRRRLSRSGELPTAISAAFTQGESAVLTVIGREVERSGDCRMPVDKIAALAGVGPTLVKRAVRLAREAGLILVEARRRGHRRNDTNIIRVIDPRWIASMKLSCSSKRTITRGVIVGANQDSFVIPTKNRDSSDRAGLWRSGWAAGDQRRSGGLRTTG